MPMKAREMYQLWCPSCGNIFLKDRIKYFKHKKGWRQYFYCSKQCWTIGAMPEHLPPTPHQSEADRKAEIDGAVEKVIKRRT